MFEVTWGGVNGDRIFVLGDALSLLKKYFTKILILDIYDVLSSVEHKQILKIEFVDRNRKV